jgi:hypothetical protein
MVDVNASLSSSTSGTSGAQFGGNSAGGGLKIPPYIIPLLIVCVFVYAVVKIIRD